jgi:hypothetical protein
MFLTAIRETQDSSPSSDRKSRLAFLETSIGTSMLVLGYNHGMARGRSVHCQPISLVAELYQAN